MIKMETTLLSSFYFVFNGNCPIFVTTLLLILDNFTNDIVLIFKIREDRFKDLNEVK